MVHPLMVLNTTLVDWLIDMLNATSLLSPSLLCSPIYAMTLGEPVAPVTSIDVKSSAGDTVNSVVPIEVSVRVAVPSMLKLRPALSSVTVN